MASIFHDDLHKQADDLNALAERIRKDCADILETGVTVLHDHVHFILNHDYTSTILYLDGSTIIEMYDGGCETFDSVDELIRYLKNLEEDFT